MRRLVSLTVAAVWLAAAACVSPASAEQVEESWRSPFGTFRGISVNAADGSCWVSSGSRVLHLGAEGQVVAQAGGLVQPMGVAVNESDGSCWVAETGRNQVLHLAADGTVLATVPGLRAGLVAVNSANGSCAVTIAVPGPSFTYDYVGIVCLAEDGAELWRSEVGMASALAASPADGSWWLAEASEVIQIRADGSEAWRHDFGGGWGLRLPTSLTVNAADGTAWVAHEYDIIRVAADGSELGRVDGTLFMSVSVDSSDGSVWVGTVDGQVLHLSAEGTQLLQVTDSSDDLKLPVASPADGSCWVLAHSGVQDQWNLPLLTSSGLVHLAANGAERWRANSGAPVSVATDPLDGSCWVGHYWGLGSGRGVARLGQDGAEVQWIGDLDVHAVAVNAADSSVWTLGGGLKHWAADGSELLGFLPFPFANDVAVNAADGSCWVVAGRMTTYAAGRTGDHWPGEVFHVAEDGTTLLRAQGFGEPHSVSVDPGDGSCWLADEGRAIHLAEDGTEVSRTEGGGSVYGWVSVDPVDGSCWGAGDEFVAHLARDGSELWRLDGCEGGPVSVNAEDGSCWMISAWTSPARVVHFAADGTEVWANTDLASDPYGFAGYRMAVSVNPEDGSCWVIDSPNGEVVRFAVAGYPVQHFGDVLIRHWAFDEVEACFAAGIVEGYWNDTYRPELLVRRDQMAVYIARALALPSGDSAVQVPSGAAEPTFPDVEAEHWAYRYIEYCAAASIVQGYPDGGYHPDEQVNRGQMAVYVARALVTPSGGAALPDPPEEPTFPDVTAGNEWAWCYPHVEYCAAEGIVYGYWDGAYRPEQAVTRDQMAVYVARAFHLSE